jgi:hypothetical protein
MQKLILPVVLYGTETWSLTLREEHSLRVFENTVLRRIFRMKRNEVTGGWRKLHNEELHNLYSSPSIIRIGKSKRTRWERSVARMDENKKANRTLWESQRAASPPYSSAACQNLTRQTQVNRSKNIIK